MSHFLLLSLIAAPALPAGFTDYGVGAKVAECRGIVAVRDGNGKNLVLALALDESPLGYILATDIESGETKQYRYPEGAGNSAVFASLLSRNGRLYTGAGPVLLEFDPTKREWLFKGVPQPKAGCFVGAAMADGPGGLIFIGTYPNCHLVSYNPQTQEMKDYGQLDPAEHYFNNLAFDDTGWAYAGIGTARWNIVACNPATGERRQILDEAERRLGTANVYPGTDGKVYGDAGGQRYRLYEGKAEKIPRDQSAPPQKGLAISWAQKSATFPDGRAVSGYDLPGRSLQVKDPKGGDPKRIPLEYDSGGVMITSLAEGPGGMVYASSAHPMHLVRVDPRAGALADLGAVPRVGGGNFCAMATLGDRVFGAQYSEGGLWAYDATQPWNPEQDVKPFGQPAGNPRPLAFWKDDVCRPRTALVHPDGKHVVIAGFAGYGRVGGGIGIYNLETGQETLLTADKELLPGHSTITLKALPNGDLVGGTSIEAPGGGHVVAKAAELYLLEWATKKIAWHAALLPGAGDIISIQVTGDGLVHGLTANATFFVLDPEERRLVHQESYAAYGSVPRHALQVAPDGKLYAMLSKAILRITPGTFAHEKMADPPAPITAGGALAGGVLYYASGARVWSYRIP